MVFNKKLGIGNRNGEASAHVSGKIVAISMPYDKLVNHLEKGSFEELMIHELLHLCHGPCLNYLVSLETTRKHRRLEKSFTFLTTILAPRP